MQTHRQNALHALATFSLATLLCACGGGGESASAQGSAPPVAPPAAAPVMATNLVPSISTAALPHATVGVAYSATLQVTNGDGASIWSVAAGTLPAGLTLSAAGVLAGMPSAAGSASITVRVADSDSNTGAADEDTQPLDLVIDPRPLPADIAAAPRALAIVVVGASTASCKNLLEGGYLLADCWVNRLSAYLQAARPGSSIVNLAVAGTGSCHALPSNAAIPAACPAQDAHPIPDALHNITQALASHPDLVILNYPGDYQIGVSATLANLLTIRDAASAAGVPVWVTTSQPAYGDPNVTNLRITQRDGVLNTFGTRTVDFWTPLVDSNGGMRVELVNHYDDLHPNDAGHRLLFEAVRARM